MSEPIIVSIILPTRNEAGNIAEVIARTHNVLSDIEHEILVVDDNSPDQTADIARQIASSDRRVRVLERIGRRGLASACIEGALSASGEIIAVMDADLQHDEAVLPQLIEAVRSEKAELAVGSRHVDGGGLGEWSDDRKSLSNFANGLARRLSKTPLSDPMSGFFAVRADTFRKLAPNMTGRGFKVLLDLVFASDRPLELAEFGYVFRTRDVGESKLDSAVGLQFLMMLYERVLGGIIPARFAMFAIVGGLGVAVHMGVLFVVHQVMGVGFLLGQSIAVIIAMTYNFLLNNLLTFRDARLKGWGLLKGWLSFNLVCGLGAIANVGVASFLFNQTGILWTLSALAGIVVGAVWNFVMASRFTWGRL